MCSKRSLSVLADTDDQQENQPRNRPKSLSQHRSKAFGDSPKANGSNVLVESLSMQGRNSISEFTKTWMALKKLGEGQTLMDSAEDSSLICSPATKRRATALPICDIRNSPRTPSTIARPRLSSSFKTSRRWTDPRSEDFLIESISDDSENESPPVIRLVPEQPSQYLPSSSKKKVAPKPSIRVVKGGYADRFQRVLKTMKMDQRHLSDRKATHKVRVLALTDEFNVTMALVGVENKTDSPSSRFNILLQSNQSKNVKVGTKLQFYLNVNIKPLQLSNKELVYCHPHNVVVL